jgi:dephospho-CoA kinase
MYTVFITGPLAAGKHAACEYLTQRGFAHIDLDEMAKEFLGEAAVRKQLVKAYGHDILSAQGGIDRARLAERAFANTENSEPLNSIIWPLVKARLSSLLVGNSCQTGPSDGPVVVEIPLLAEAPDMRDLANTVLCITAEPQIRVERALARGMQAADLFRRMALQASDKERAAIADTVIENNGSLASLHAQLDDWLATLQQEHLF